MLWQKKKKRKRLLNLKQLLRLLLISRRKSFRKRLSLRKRRNAKAKKARWEKMQKGFVSGKSFLRCIRTVD